MPAVVGRRWAAQVLAGPALTSLQQGMTPGVTNSYSRNVPNYALPNEVQGNEQPSTGYGVQVQLRRALSGRWSFSTGLGYHEYGNQVAYTVTSPLTIPSTIPASAPPGKKKTEYSHRDTYRFLTVPVRLSYVLGRPLGRLSYGLVAGADAAFYLGGTTLDANGNLQTWRSSGSPYRSLSMALSAGLDVRYRLAQRLELVAQPTVSYFLTSLAQPAAGLTPRNLLGAGGMLGVSYDFR